jgi:hypothetical protein
MEFAALNHLIMIQAGGKTTLSFKFIFKQKGYQRRSAFNLRLYDHQLESRLGRGYINVRKAAFLTRRSQRVSELPFISAFFL